MIPFSDEHGLRKYRRPWTAVPHAPRWWVVVLAYLLGVILGWLIGEAW